MILAKEGYSQQSIGVPSAWAKADVKGVASARNLCVHFLRDFGGWALAVHSASRKQSELGREWIWYSFWKARNHLQLGCIQDADCGNECRVQHRDMATTRQR